jgi:hypothetical protein
LEGIPEGPGGLETKAFFNSVVKERQERLIDSDDDLDDDCINDLKLQVKGASMTYSRSATCSLNKPRRERS